MDHFAKMTPEDFRVLSNQFGIYAMDGIDIKHVLNDDTRARLAMDAQPALVTVSNTGIPSYLANYIDPNFVKVLVTPNKAAKILGEAKKGDWTTATATFPVVEHTGEVSSYGDYSENGSVNFNANFPYRQSYHYQTITQWGERQLEVMGLAKIDAAARLNVASAIVLDKFQNNTYFYGVAGLQNYGLLNDPSLLPSIAPGVKAYNSGNSGPWITNGAVTATANEIYTDIQILFNQLVLQSGGLIDMESKLVLALAPSSEVALTTTNQYNVNVYDLIKKNFPNLRIENAMQYQNSTGGNLVQLIAEEVEGQQTAFCAFTEKMRMHPIIRSTSSFKQKKTQGSWGTVVLQPFAIASMLGV